MSDSDEDYLQLRSRRVNRDTRSIIEANVPRQNTSTPIQSLSPPFEELSRSIREATRFYREVSNLVDRNLSAQHFSTLFPDLTNSSIHYHIMNPQPIFNKEMADLMATNIPKFELNSITNPALELRSFIKSCENVLNLFPAENQNAKEEFFILIRFRLGYNVQERITVDKFESIIDLETHLRSVCHLKLNKGKLLNEIRHERQNHNEDVSHFAERLRKLIAQGRSEYPNDREFEREAIRTLKNSVKNELISIKLLDSPTDKFEELAEIAINRDSELHQRSYNTSKSESTISPDLINELMQKIKILESKPTANIQHIRQEPAIRASHHTNNRYNEPSRSPQRPFCNFCKRSGHNIDECRSKNRSNNLYRTNYNSFNKQESPRNFNNQSYLQNRNNPRNRGYPAATRLDYDRNYQNEPNHVRHQYSNSNFQRNQPPNSTEHELQRNESQCSNFRDTRNDPITCVRCNKNGHKPNNCYEIICSICIELGHSNSNCQQGQPQRRVHFHGCTISDEDTEEPPQLVNISSERCPKN